LTPCFGAAAIAVEINPIITDVVAPHAGLLGRAVRAARSAARHRRGVRAPVA
jgi:hypothetical protein